MRAPARPNISIFDRSLPQRGATIVEYALLLAMIAIVSISALNLIGLQVQTAFCQVEIGGSTSSMPGTRPTRGDGEDRCRAILTEAWRRNPERYGN